MTAWLRSRLPLLSGWNAVVSIFSISNSSQSSFMRLDVKLLPRSDSITFGMPNMEKYELVRILIIVFAVWSFNGYACINFVNWSCNLNIYLLPLVDFHNGPTMSIAILSLNSFGVSVIFMGTFLGCRSIFLC